MNLPEAHQIVTEAFDAETGYYYNHTPHEYNNFIDGMAWVGLLWGACLKTNDVALAEKCQRYITNVLCVGKDARAFAPHKVSESWVQSENMSGYWYRPKKQSFAGPAGLEFAIQCGAPVDSETVSEGMSWSVRTIYSIKKKLFTTWPIPNLFGLLVKHIEWLKQHINSMWLAFLVTNKEVPESMEWMKEENPFFSYIDNTKCSTEYPPTNKLEDVVRTTRNSVVPLEDTKPSTWIFRRDPFISYSGTPTNKEYTPIWMVVAEKLQSTI